MSGRLRIPDLALCAIAILACHPTFTFGQTATDSTTIDSIHGPYAGYKTWKEYLAHQDSLPRKEENVQLEWFTFGLGTTSALPYTNSYIAGLIGVSYEPNHFLIRLRYLEARDAYSTFTSESLDEFDAMFGFGEYNPIFVNVTIGIGYRHRFHYLSDPYQNLDEIKQGILPPHVEVSYVALPLQAEFFIPFGDTFGIGLTCYGTWTHDGFDHGFLLNFDLGKLTGSNIAATLPPFQSGHP